ncbi:MAG: tyrosine-type recombinase/integrase [Candidatus Dojkabacteria bacterium]|nr:tyrosine-type recombinase/integrase [Candidatus Dojkabacteria bacterium]
MNLSDAQNAFISYLKDQKRSESTITAYSKDIQQLSDFIGSIENIEDVDLITSEHLNNFVAAIKSDKKCNYTLKTVSRKINSMKTFFKFLFATQKTKTDPALSVGHPKYKTLPPRVLTRLEYRALRDVARTNVRLYTIVEILLQTGIRIGELARLTLDDLKIDDNKKFLNIEAYGSNEKRTVEINEIALEAIKNYLQIRPQTKAKVDSLFVTKTGNALLVRNIRTSISRAFAKAGIKSATVNDIRNTFIVHQLKNGMTVETIGEVVGHKRLTSTKKYLQFITEKPKRKSTKIVPL